MRLDEDLEELRGAQLLEERAHRLRRPLEEARLVEGRVQLAARGRPARSGARAHVLAVRAEQADLVRVRVRFRVRVRVRFRVRVRVRARFGVRVRVRVGVRVGVGL